MRDDHLKGTVGVGFILSHFGLLGQLLYYFKTGTRFAWPEVSTAAVILSPMLASYTAIMIRYIMSDRPPSTKVRGTAYSLLSLFIPVLFVLSLAVLSAFKVSGDLSFDDYKKSLALVETVFGVYMAPLVASLFEGQAAAAPASPTGASNVEVKVL